MEVNRGNRKRTISGDPSSYGLGSFLPADDLDSDVGDLIEIDRTLYTDWALYEGAGYVIHVSGVKGENIPTDTMGTVRRDQLRHVAGHNGVRVNNKEVGAHKRSLEALPVDRVLDQARRMVGLDVEYNLLTRNAEHFTTEWKYGVGWSDQAAMAINVIKSLGCDRNSGQQLLHSLTAILQTPPNLSPRCAHLIAKDRNRRSSSTPPIGLNPTSLGPIIPGPVIPKYNSSSRPPSGRTTPCNFA